MKEPLDFPDAWVLVNDLAENVDVASIVIVPLSFKISPVVRKFDAYVLLPETVIVPLFVTSPETVNDEDFVASSIVVTVIVPLFVSVWLLETVNDEEVASVVVTLIKPEFVTLPEAVNVESSTAMP